MTNLRSSAIMFHASLLSHESRGVIGEKLVDEPIAFSKHLGQHKSQCREESGPWPWPLDKLTERVRVESRK